MKRCRTVALNCEIVDCVTQSNFNLATSKLLLQPVVLSHFDYYKYLLNIINIQNDYTIHSLNFSISETAQIYVIFCNSHIFIYIFYYPYLLYFCVLVLYGKYLVACSSLRYALTHSLTKLFTIFTANSTGTAVVPR